MKKRLLYMYSVTHDSGNAPCVYENEYQKTHLLSLACCKGGQVSEKVIRVSGMRYHIGGLYEKLKEEKIDDKYEIWVAGIYNKKLLYFAKISEIITIDDYYKNAKYQKRQDCIYECDEQLKLSKKYDSEKIPGYKRKKRFNPLFHSEDNEYQAIRDLIGKYVLLSDKFVYFGKKAIDIDLNNKNITNNRTTKYPAKFRKIFYSDIIENYEESGKIIDQICKVINEYSKEINLSQANIMDEPHEILLKDSKGCYQK